MGDIQQELAELDHAERRLDQRARLRAYARERRERRVEWRRRWLGDGVRVPALAVLGTVALMLVLETGGGDLREWPQAAAIAALVALSLGPAALAGWLARTRGAQLAVAVAVATFGAQLALTYGVAFALLGLGPK